MFLLRGSTERFLGQAVVALGELRPNATTHVTRALAPRPTAAADAVRGDIAVACHLTVDGEVSVQPAPIPSPRGRGGSSATATAAAATPSLAAADGVSRVTATPAYAVPPSGSYYSAGGHGSAVLSPGALRLAQLTGSPSPLGFASPASPFSPPARSVSLQDAPA